MSSPDYGELAEVVQRCAVRGGGPVWSAACLALWLACGCDDKPQAPPPATPTAPAEPVVAPASAPLLRYTGWVEQRTTGEVRMAWPGSQIEIGWSGGSLQVELTDTPVDDETRETDWLAVVFDDVPARPIPLREGRHVYTLATNLAGGEHRALLWKRTEAEVGSITLHSVRLDSGESLEPLPERPEKRLLFIGDSITAGYGNEGPNGDCHWNAAQENNYATYGAVAARELGAEYVAMAWSGKGLTRNYEARDKATMPELWQRVIPTDDASPPLPKDRADAVIVNLGTNDFFKSVPSSKTFIATLGALLNAIRARYPDAHLVLALGPMLADDHPQPRARTRLRKWLEAVRAERRKAGDDAHDLIEFWTDPAEGVGCDFHPNLKTHERMGKELATLLREKLDD